MITTMLPAALLVLAPPAHSATDHPGPVPGLIGVWLPHRVDPVPEGFVIGHFMTGCAQLPRTPAATPEEVADFAAESRRVALATAARLAAGLGPAWRVSSDGSAFHIAGPIDQGGRGAERGLRAQMLASAIKAIGDEVRSQERAGALPVGSGRDAAIEASRKAAEEAEQALLQLRVETQVFHVRHAAGEDVARALKLALPWGAFSAVGGTQIVAGGTRAELDAASALVRQLDDAAARDHQEAVAAFAAHNQLTQSGRILASPINIDFRGGTLPEYLRLVGNRAGAESWVLEDPRLANALVPEIRLTGVTADSAIRMLDGLLFAAGERGSPANARFTVHRIDAAPGSDGPPIYRIGAVFPRTADANTGNSTPQQNITRVFEVGLQHLQGTPESEKLIAEAQAALLAAIETGIDLTGASSGFRLKLHTPTGLLFVSGTPEEVALVHMILDQWVGPH